MTTIRGSKSEAATLRSLIETAAEAVRNRDIEGSISYYAPDILIFDVVTPLRTSGLDAGRERLNTWFSSFDGPLDFSVNDLAITAGEDVAFATSLNRIQATRNDGELLEMWWRATLCFEKRDGHWQVTHAHSSAPMDIETGAAAIDLKP